MNPLLVLWVGASAIYLATQARIDAILAVFKSIGQPKAAPAGSTADANPPAQGAPAATPPPPIINT